MKLKTRNALIITYVVAQALDIVLTVLMIRYLGGQEINPFLRGMSPFQIASIKALIASLAFTILKQNHFAGWVYWAVALVSSFPVLRNVTMLGVAL